MAKTYAKRDIYQEVTDRIVEMLAKGVPPWRKSWADGTSAVNSLPLRSNGEAYRGINTLLLWAESMNKDYQCKHWFTYKQATAMGASVPKGSKSTEIVFFKPMTVEDKVTGKEKTIPMLRYYWVFNGDQLEDLPEEFKPKKNAKPIPLAKRLKAVDNYIANTKAMIKDNSRDRAFYSPATDTIQMPPLEAFDTKESYYAVRLHELVHWTGHESRIDRLKSTSYGSREYAFEELIAELGAAFLCAKLEITNKPREDHASYINSWLKALKDDKRYIFQAASMSTKACDYMNELQQQEQAVAA
jgi:antirestriction protein ArdC